MNRYNLDIAQIEADSKAIEAAIRAAVRDALLEHKLLGQPIVVADDDDNIVWVPAEEIEIPELDENDDSISDASYGFPTDVKP